MNKNVVIYSHSNSRLYCIEHNHDYFNPKTGKLEPSAGSCWRKDLRRLVKDYLKKFPQSKDTSGFNELAFTCQITLFFELDKPQT